MSKAGVMGTDPHSQKSAGNFWLPKIYLLIASLLLMGNHTNNLHGRTARILHVLYTAFL